MRKTCIGLALMILALPATARSQSLVAATNPERDSAFAGLADCETALGGVARLSGKAGATDPAGPRGSVFNRAAGNLSRCERVHGEYQIVVYPNSGRAPDAD